MSTAVQWISAAEAPGRRLLWAPVVSPKRGARIRPRATPYSREREVCELLCMLRSYAYAHRAAQRRERDSALSGLQYCTYCVVSGPAP